MIKNNYKNPENFNQSGKLNLLQDTGKEECIVRNNSKTLIKITEIKFITGATLGKKKNYHESLQRDFQTNKYTHLNLALVLSEN